MATITCLPDEVIAIILSYSDITIENIINFRCVCKQFRWAAKYDKHLEKKFVQRWFSAKKLYDMQSKENEQTESEENEQKNKIIFIVTGINYARELRSYVSQIIHEYYYVNEPIVNYENKLMDNLTKFQDVFQLDEHLKNYIDEIIIKPQNFIKYSFFIDEIKNLLTQCPRETGCDLTERYIDIKLFHYMRQGLIQLKYDKFKQQSYRKLLLERMATILAQWLQPEKDVFYSCVEASLDSIAQEVLNCLREKHPNHSIFSTSDEIFSYWKNNNIDDNHWNEEEGTEIMNTLKECIFGKLGFKRNRSEEKKYSEYKEYMCIDYVLKNKCGEEIILLIIFHSVARRLGLRCDVKLLHHSSFCIYWKLRYSATSLSENVECFSICSKNFPDCFVNQLSLFMSLNARKYFIDGCVITANLMWHMMTELFPYLIHEHNIPSCDILHQYGWSVINSYFYNFQSSPHVKKTDQLNTRPKDVKFAVGMIVTHRNQLIKLCAGVIVGWHRYVDKHTFFLEIVRNSNMDKYNLSLNHCNDFNSTKQQTYYIILIENHKMCYAGEDDIILTTPKWIENSEIGRYFCKFENTHYVPNKMLASLYPHDAAITAQITISENL